MKTRRKQLRNKPEKFKVPKQRQLSLTESVGGSWIQQKMSQFKNIYTKVDETLDAVFTLLIPGTDPKTIISSNANNMVTLFETPCIYPKEGHFVNF